jgi:glycosyltransferase involved in cell wall biosynthesis
MKVSVCVPNYNYGAYLGTTLESVLDQGYADVEVVISDNASTDDSWSVAEGFVARDARVLASRSDRNHGFAANLDRAVQMSSSPWCVLLSSDDLMLPGALDTYAAVVEAAGARNERFAVTSITDVVDSDGVHTGVIGSKRLGWGDFEVDEEVSAAVGRTVLSVSAKVLLAASLRRLRNPVPFLSTMFPRAAYDAVGGYTGQRIINPDKWFHWRLLGELDRVYLVDDPQFAYRVHGNNQLSQQAASGALKFWVDEYVATFQVPEDLLTYAGVTREELVDAFVEIDIIQRGFLAIAFGDRATARRLVPFGRAAYPGRSRSLKLFALAVASRGGPPATALAARAARRFDPGGDAGGWSPS